MSLRDEQQSREDAVTTSSRARDRHSRGRGQSLVELALALPLLLLLLLGTVDIGRAFFDYIQMRNGAFEGVRYGSRVPKDTTGIQTAVSNHGVPSGTSVSVSCSNGNCSTITTGANVSITVTATHTFTPITTSFLNRFFGIGVFNLSASASMKVMT